MKIEKLQETLSYIKLKEQMMLNGSMFALSVLFLAGGLGYDVIVLTVYGILGSIIFAYFSWNHLNSIYKIKAYVKSFELTEGKIVNFNQDLPMRMRGATSLLVEFDDFMGEHHRMPTHKIFKIYDLATYIEANVNVYYSKHLDVVLIGMKKQVEEISEVDPYQL